MKPSISKNSTSNVLIISYKDKKIPFYSSWLYERSKNKDIRDSETGQLLIEASDIKKNLKIISTKIMDKKITIKFSDNTTHYYNISELLMESMKTKIDNSDKELWNNKNIKITKFNFNNYNNLMLKNILRTVDKYGFAYIKNIPITKNGIQSLSDDIGPIKRTNWGEIADIKSITNAYDLTMTSRTLENHTDNPYRFPTQGYIFLHCLKNSDSGGENSLADGFNIAHNIKEKNKKTFNTLTNYKTFFRYKDKDTCLENSCSLIELDDNKNVIQVRFNNRTEVLPYDTIENTKKYRDARKKFWNEITNEENNLIIKQEPGDMLIIDNYRIFHGRKGYIDKSNSRYFRQGYMDRDILQSKFKLLN